jgi:hypothetical protein
MHEQEQLSTSFVVDKICKVLNLTPEFKMVEKLNDLNEAENDHNNAIYENLGINDSNNFAEAEFIKIKENDA